MLEEATSNSANYRFFKFRILEIDIDKRSVASQESVLFESLQCFSFVWILKQNAYAIRKCANLSKPKIWVPQISKFINQIMRPEETGAVEDQRSDHVAVEIYGLREHSW